MTSPKEEELLRRAVISQFGEMVMQILTLQARIELLTAEQAAADTSTAEKNNPDPVI